MRWCWEMKKRRAHSIHHHHFPNLQPHNVGLLVVWLPQRKVMSSTSWYFLVRMMWILVQSVIVKERGDARTINHMALRHVYQEEADGELQMRKEQVLSSDQIKSQRRNFLLFFYICQFIISCPPQLSFGKWNTGERSWILLLIIKLRFTYWFVCPDDERITYLFRVGNKTCQSLFSSTSINKGSEIYMYKKYGCTEARQIWGID